MPSCVVRKCKNYMKKLPKSQGITYHTFPKDVYRREQWIQIIRRSRGEMDWNPSSASTVCSAHFDEEDFKITTKLRCLRSFAVPRRYLSLTNTDPAELNTARTSPIPQTSSNDEEVAIYQRSSSLAATISSELQDPLFIVKMELMGSCRLCAASEDDDKLLDLQTDKDLKTLVVKMLSRLNTNIDFDQENLPATICSACAKKLYTAYDFVGGIDKAQASLTNTTNTATPENLEDLESSYNASTSSQTVLTNIGPACNSDQLQLRLTSPPASNSEQLQLSWTSSSPNHSEQLELSLNSPPESHSEQLELSLNSPPESHSEQPELSLTSPFICELSAKADLRKKRKQIVDQRKKIKTLNQRIRRLLNRNRSLKTAIQNLKKP